MPKTVLVVDDSTSMRQMVYFHHEGSRLRRDRGQQRQNTVWPSGIGKSVNLVVTDLNMPVMDGMTMIRQLRQTRVQVYADPHAHDGVAAEKKLEGKAAGATGWIVKPFNPEQLLQVVAKVGPEDSVARNLFRSNGLKLILQNHAN